MGEKLLYFLSGLGIGATVALLWAPKSGSETRADLTDSLAEGREYVRQQASDINDALAGTIQRGKEVVRETSKMAADAFDQGKAALQRS